MAMLEEVADELAKRTAELVDKTGDEKLEQMVADAIGASSPTLEEAFATAMRIRRAERRGQNVLDKVAAELGESGAIELPPPEDFYT
jgi:uncharacterized membrane-anchored protein YjiN (DUF445 family)